MDIFTDSSDSDEYVALYRKERIEREKIEKAKEEAKRDKEYEKYYYENVDDPTSIFKLKGLTVIKFTHKKIKFSFVPRKIIKLIRGTTIFYCSLRYTYKWWMIMNNSIPIDARKIIYQKFLENYVVKREEVVSAVYFIYDTLVDWCDSYEEYKQEKFQRYLEDPDEVFLHSEDEELFLTKEQIEERHKKIDKILKRMIPPQQPAVSERLKKRKATKKFKNR